MNKRRLHHYWTKLRPISPWYFLAAFLIFLGISVNALRQNNLHMVKLRSAVYQADQHSGDVEAALQELRKYVHAHMNTNLSSGNTSIKPPIQLKYRYERLVKTEKDKTAATNTNVYNEAQAICEKQFPGSVSGGPRVPCIQDYVTTHGAKEKPVTDALYKFDFVSPIWSPDLAGWSLATTALLLFLFLLRYGLERWTKSVLRAHE